MIYKFSKMENKARVAENLDNLRFQENNVLLLNIIFMPDEGKVLLILQEALFCGRV